jgi:hypothetical protein
MFFKNERIEYELFIVIDFITTLSALNYNFYT